MQCQDNDRRTRDNSSSASQASNQQITERQTYYYSKFELFEEEDNTSAYGRYRVFLDKLLLDLGDDWRVEANLIAMSPTFGSGFKCIFDTSLEIWLEINRMQKSKEIKEEDPNINYENVYYELFLQKLRHRLTAICNFDPQALSTLAMGFFFSAGQIWQSIVNERRDPPKKSGMFSLFSQTLEKQRNQFFRPLMRVKQRIFTFFNKKVKGEEMEINHTSFTKFRQNLEDEQEIERRMERIKIEEGVGGNETEVVTREKSQTSSVVFEKIPENNPINQSLLQSAYKYIQGIISTKDKWQVARGFVTSILEINYNKVAEEISGKESKQKEGDEEINVRVLKPANDFYHNLMVVWLLFRGDSDYRIKFKQYLERVKATLGTAWREHYIEPTKIFFSSLNSHWTKLACESESTKRNDEEIIEIFVERVKENMKTAWQEKIVKKEGEFGAKLMD